MRHVLGKVGMQKPPARPFTGPSSHTKLVRKKKKKKFLGLNHAFRVLYVYYTFKSIYPDFRGLRIGLEPSE